MRDKDSRMVKELAKQTPRQRHSRQLAQIEQSLRRVSSIQARKSVWLRQGASGGNGRSEDSVGHLKTLVLTLSENGSYRRVFNRE